MLSDTAIGFTQLLSSVQKKTMRKGFHFTILVVGESGLGKSTLINSLFLTDMHPDRIVPSAGDKLKGTTTIEPSTVEIEEDGVRVKLTIVDTPGYGDFLDNRNCFQTVLSYVDKQFESYFLGENSLHRRFLVDCRVHACLYFISPFGRGLKPLDLTFIKMLHRKVNLIPVIAKSDSLTRKELADLRSVIMKELGKNKIICYLPEDYTAPVLENEAEFDDSKEIKFPFAVCGANSVVSAGGGNVRGRLYPWGFLDVENSNFCDLSILRQFLIQRMQDLLDETHEVLYETYRLERMTQVMGYN